MTLMDKEQELESCNPMNITLVLDSKLRTLTPNRYIYIYALSLRITHVLVLIIALL